MVGVDVPQKGVEAVRAAHKKLKEAQQELHRFATIFNDTSLFMWTEKWADGQELRLRREGKWSEEVEE